MKPCISGCATGFSSTPAGTYATRLLETGAGARVRLDSDGRGHWRRDGCDCASLDGCIDIDVEATPFTNTLPIRRLGLATGEGRVVRLAYVRIPSLEVVPRSQRYTAVDAARLYRFESLEHSFTADLPLDERWSRGRLSGSLPARPVINRGVTSGRGDQPWQMTPHRVSLCKDTQFLIILN